VFVDFGAVDRDPVRRAMALEITSLPHHNFVQKSAPLTGSRRLGFSGRWPTQNRRSEALFLVTLTELTELRHIHTP